MATKIQFSRDSEPILVLNENIFEFYIKDNFLEELIINDRHCRIRFENGTWKGYIDDVSIREYRLFLRKNEDDKPGYMPQPHGGWTSHRRAIFNCGHWNDIALNNKHFQNGSFKNRDYVLIELAICTRFLKDNEGKNPLKRKLRATESIPQKVRRIIKKIEPMEIE